MDSISVQVFSEGPAGPRMFGRFGMRYSKWLLAAALVASGAPAHAQVSGIFFFGDSNSDSGRYLYLPEVKGDPTTFATGGGFTPHPGPMFSLGPRSYFGF